jgi:antitoxin (DNA-binding transcriptional repressor) of toxin-antitoxin stability system
MVRIASRLDFQRDLERYLQRVGDGESFELCDHDRPIAVLSPPPPPKGTALQQIMAERQIRPARLDLLELGPPPKLTSGLSISQALAELRAED